MYFFCTRNTVFFVLIFICCVFCIFPKLPGKILGTFKLHVLCFFSHSNKWTDWNVYAHYRYRPGWNIIFGTISLTQLNPTHPTSNLRQYYPIYHHMWEWKARKKKEEVYLSLLLMLIIIGSHNDLPDTTVGRIWTLTLSFGVIMSKNSSFCDSFAKIL